MSRRGLWLGAGVVLLLALAYHLVALGSLPPGLDRDAAANGWLALKWLRYDIVPFWMPHASAPEPLIVWLQTLMTGWWGPSVTALRSASALFLAFAAVTVYWLTLEVAKPFPHPQRWWAAMLAGTVFACNPVITQLARTGLRASTLPLLAGLFALALLRAWHTNARRDYLLSGVVLGVAAYTYLAARFLPVVIVVFVAIALWLEYRAWGKTVMPAPDAATTTWRRHLRARLVGLLLMVGAAFVIVLPQLIFFVRYPAAFLERAQSVSLLTNPAYQESGLTGVVVDKVIDLLLMFGIEWWGQYNQASQPLLLPIPFIGLLLALPLIFQWRRHPAMLLTVVTLAIMTLPDLIGGDRVRPHELRVIGIFVPTTILSGIGLAYGAAWLVRWVRGTMAWHVVGALLTMLIVAWSSIVWFGMAAPELAQSDYAWFARPDVRVAEAINDNDVPMLVPLNEYSRSVIAYLTAKRVGELRSGIDANGQVVQPSSERVLLLWPADPARARVESTSYRFDPQSLVLIDNGRAYLMPPAGSDVARLQSRCDAEMFTTAIGEGAGAICEVDLAQFEFPTQLPAPTWPVDDLYDGALRLQEVSVDRTALLGGAALGVTSFWQAAAPTHDRWRYFVHLLDDHQQLVAGDDFIPGYGVYEAQLWQRDEIVPLRQSVQLPAALPAGRYWIEVGLYDPLNGVRARVESTGADRTLVGPLKVPLQESTTLSDATPLAARFGDEIALDGYQLTQGDGEVRVTLRLSALRQPAQDYTAFLHVEDASGALVAQRDAQPLDGAYPTSIWDAGEVVVANWVVALPTELAAGQYRVWMGLYDGQSGARLPVQADGGVVDADRLLVQEIELP